MIQIDLRSQVPIFEQIFNQVRKMMILGIFKEKDQLPTVRQLARDLGVNPNTISKAYTLCEQYQLVESQPGLGYFVLNPENAKVHAISYFKQAFQLHFKQMRELGLDDKYILEMIKEELHA